jgi:hypothetical protein
MLSLSILALLTSRFILQYSIKNKISVVPTWTKGPQVLLPPSMISWLARQPEKELSARDCTFESQQFKYTLQHPEIQHNDMLDVMIKRDLTKSVGQLNNGIIEEIDLCAKELFETDVDADGWKDVSVWDAVIKIVTRADNRCFVGKELCKLIFVVCYVTFPDDVIFRQERGILPDVCELDHGNLRLQLGPPYVSEVPQAVS